MANKRNQFKGVPVVMVRFLGEGEAEAVTYYNGMEINSSEYAEYVIKRMQHFGHIAWLDYAENN